MLKNINENIINKKMFCCIKSFEKNILKYNINNLDIKIIGNLLINYYGNNIRLLKISRITIENNNTYRISLFDNSIKNIVKKKIYRMDLDFNIYDDKNDILVYFSPITEEKKKKIIKLIKNDIELAKICIRNIRKIFNDNIKLLFKNKLISEDEKIKNFINLQKLTDLYINKINFIFLEKKKLILNK